MLTIENFVSQYEKYSDEDLFHSYQNIDDYSADAKEALFITIDKRGGIEVLTEKMKQLQVVEKEKRRIAFEVKKLSVANTDLDFLKRLIHSAILSPTETEETIEEQYSELQKIKEDLAIKPKTIIGCIIGGLLGSLIGGSLWGLQMIQMHRMFYIFLVGLAILSYGLIRFFTKQSKANIAVGVATVLSVAGALVVGQLLFEIYG